MTVERVAALEVKQEITATQIEKLDQTVRSGHHDIALRLEKLSHEIADVKTSMGRQRGFVAGVAAAVSLVWTAAVAAVSVAWNRIIE